METLAVRRVEELLRTAARTRILVVGDVMLDQFLWGKVDRISPEAPVPVLEFERESYMPGGAANVARNLTALGAGAELFAVMGRDESGRRLVQLLEGERVGCAGLLAQAHRPTSIKTRIIAHRQQVVRVDRESRLPLDPAICRRLRAAVVRRLDEADAVIVGDYAKGVVTQRLLDELKSECRRRGTWLSLDPKPAHRLDLQGVSLLTPNRKEAFELLGRPDDGRGPDPLADAGLVRAAEDLLAQLRPALLLITLGEQGMLLCCSRQPLVHIPTVAREVFDVSGAGDTVIAAFTLAVAAGASPLEAARFSNQAAGVVVGKLGTATVGASDLLASDRSQGHS
ncbi:MAG: D-glycero-beta-D-manno-heptose-7-phosphate kinase [Verrucomicrobia bacterium]|nr:D-glycero-beta-D-manno-heptose-7-phosphate kinase [Verrucomicrobiota bacterium]